MPRETPDLATYCARLLDGTGLDPADATRTCTDPTASAHPAITALREGWAAPDRCPPPAALTPADPS